MQFHFKSPLTVYMHFYIYTLHLYVEKKDLAQKFYISLRTPLMKWLSSLRLVAQMGFIILFDYPECYKVHITHVLLQIKLIKLIPI